MNFEFEGGLGEAANDAAIDVDPTSVAMQNANLVADAGVFGSGVGGQQSLMLVTQQLHSNKNYRQTVCRHWLRGLCMKGDMCGFLHQFDKSKMPVCRFFAKFGECREVDCPFKHSETDIKDCNMYNLGFCIHGNQCRYRHIKKPGPPPTPEEIAEALRHGGLNKEKDGQGSSINQASFGRGRGRGRGYNNPNQYQQQQMLHMQEIMAIQQQQQMAMAGAPGSYNIDPSQYQRQQQQQAMAARQQNTNQYANNTEEPLCEPCN